MILFSLLGVYANAEKVLLPYTPTKKRAKCEAVLKAVAAGNAGNADNAGNIEKNTHPKTKRSDIRCEMFDQKKWFENQMY